MNNEIVLISVPIRTHYDKNHRALSFYEDYKNIVTNYYEEYVPGYLQPTLEYLIREIQKNKENTKNKKTQERIIIRQEELSLKADQKHEVDINDLIIKGREIKKKYSNAKRIICVGPSHVGALMLYEDDDVVARYDCHGDYSATHSKANPARKEKLVYNLANYMNGVEDNFRNIRVINYGVQRMSTYGETGIGEEYLEANHFDIDIDVFDKKYNMNNSEQKSYFHTQDLLRMIKQADPRKIGVWEYRPEEDKERNALRFIKEVLKIILINVINETKRRVAEPLQPLLTETHLSELVSSL